MAAPLAALRFASRQDYLARLGDVEFWRPFIAEVLGREGIAMAGRDPEPGAGMTYPTFICGDAVIKLYGGFPSWRKAHGAERMALAALSADPEIAAPRVLAAGQLIGMALWRQAHGLAQHHSMDVFHKLPALIHLREVATFDQLAVSLFDVNAGRMAAKRPCKAAIPRRCCPPPGR